MKGEHLCEKGRSLNLQKPPLAFSIHKELTKNLHANEVQTHLYIFLSPSHVNGEPLLLHNNTYILQKFYHNPLLDSMSFLSIYFSTPIACKRRAIISAGCKYCYAEILSQPVV